MGGAPPAPGRWCRQLRTGHPFAALPTGVGASAGSGRPRTTRRRRTSLMSSEPAVAVAWHGRVPAGRWV